MSDPIATPSGHVALLNEMVGVGILAMSDPEQDVSNPAPSRVWLESIGEWAIPGGTLSMQATDYNEMMRQLAELGWDLLEDEGDGGPVDVEVGGRTGWSLYKEDSIISNPTFEEIAAAERALLEELGRWAG